MDFRALCVKLVMSVIILLCAHDQKIDAASLHILPNRLQFFEYEAVTFYCDGVDYCEVVHKVKGKIKTCPNTKKRTPTGSSCTITNVYLDDSGEYWYETEGGIRSNSINISVTAGSVILESPAIPVMEGEAVTLSCRNKLTPSDFMADFYKYGVHISNTSTGNMTIHKVSKSDEGYYKCSILGVGESPESWLSVTETKTDPSSQPSCHIYLVLRTVFTIIMVALLLLLVGLLHSGKIGATNPNLSSIP
ncbi:low affinity immunoglobulin gamma Fc region receptor II-like [Oreochromis aureus]|uniref:Ig-like domain-containing protein n=1 Tax=Oreochromis aureus TaxID=47969 RepID=A0AAZ1Y4R0_OREAU|nr:low affinity immunoglobulin gamma Fc region receptor II-like [Oreochromis aureus]